MLFARAHFVATTPKPTSSKAAKLGLKSSSELAAERAQAAAAAEEAKDGSVGIVGNTVVDGQAQKLKAKDMLHFESNIDGLMISGTKTRLHADEQEDGDERPDLNLDIVGRR